jgi:hypothetical protein
MNRVTQKKGDLALAKAIVYFTELGYEILLPMTESAEYDLVVDTGEELKKIQVKYCSGTSVDLRKIHSNSQGYVVNRYTAKSFDWLYVYSPSRGEFLFTTEWQGKDRVPLRR